MDKDTNNITSPSNNPPDSGNTSPPSGLVDGVVKMWTSTLDSVTKLVSNANASNMPIIGPIVGAVLITLIILVIVLKSGATKADSVVFAGLILITVLCLFASVINKFGQNPDNVLETGQKARMQKINPQPMDEL